MPIDVMPRGVIPIEFKPIGMNPIAVMPIAFTFVPSLVEVVMFPTLMRLSEPS